MRKVHVKSKVCRARTVGGSVILKVGSCFFVITAEQNHMKVRIDAKPFFCELLSHFFVKKVYVKSKVHGWW